ncbi:hypothetical protein HG531_010879 [Fusarium graminearum]|nr:hypothetical protein HG531_010879 [Fusarium graminearum]
METKSYLAAADREAKKASASSLGVCCLQAISAVFESICALSSLKLLLKASSRLGASPSRNVAIEQGIDLLEGLASGFGVHKECVYSHGNTKGAEDHVCLPLNVGEGWGHEKSQSKVEAKVPEISREADTLGSVLERKDFTGVDPGDRCPGKTVNSDKDHQSHTKIDNRPVYLQQLLPDLDTNTNNGALPNTRCEETKVSNILGLVGDSNSFTNLFHLGEDNRAVKIATGVKVGKVKDLRTGDTDSDTTDNTTNNKMGDVLGRALQNSTGDPEETSNHEGLTTTKTISDASCDKGSNERSCRHGSCDAALLCRAGVVEVLEILV